MTTLHEAFTAGYVSLSAWSDLLDRINVFPVADADTGANLRISLSPLRACPQETAPAAEQIIHSATGNSGNIAAAFFSILLQATSPAELPDRIEAGCRKARAAVVVPKDGTMLSVFDTLAEQLAASPSLDATRCKTLLAELQRTVRATANIQDHCRQAGVVDAGALGMYVFFDGFFRSLTGMVGESPSLFALFSDHLSLDADFRPPTSDEYCVDVLLAPNAEHPLDPTHLAGFGESVVVVPEQTTLKIHIHTPDPRGLQARLADLGALSRWSAEPLQAQDNAAETQNLPTGCLHIMTDAAGSLPRELARQYNISLLDSYIIHGDSARPESLCDPGQVYGLMRHNQRLTTAQASLAERHQRYRNVLAEFGKTLYLCVGSVFTGNHAVAQAWKEQQDGEQLLEVIDTGAASGRLGLLALMTARMAQRTSDAAAVRDQALHLSRVCREYVFIDNLRYLAAGGRVSRAGGLFGNLLGLKPIISPTATGVRKEGLVRSREAQLAFACDTMRKEIITPNRAVLLLQYSDNEAWVREVAQTQLQDLLPRAEILLVPLSLTSGSTWGRALGRWPLPRSRNMGAAIVIPVYNHGPQIAAVLAAARPLGLPIIVVNDGSTDSTATVLKQQEGITLLQHAENQGKGAALLTGFAEAARTCDWALSIDADGQHDPADAQALLATAERGERRIVVGNRQGMAGIHVPWTSRFGRGFSNFWVLVSGGPRIEDSQSGYRLYPLPETLRLGVVARRYQFEVEVLVRAKRAGIDTVEVPVSVVYQPKGVRVSHFRPWHDFLRNSSTFSRLICSRIFHLGKK